LSINIAVEGAIEHGGERAFICMLTDTNFLSTVHVNIRTSWLQLLLLTLHPSSRRNRQLVCTVNGAGQQGQNAVGPSCSPTVSRPVCHHCRVARDHAPSSVTSFQIFDLSTPVTGRTEFTAGQCYRAINRLANDTLAAANSALRAVIMSRPPS